MSMKHYGIMTATKIYQLTVSELADAILETGAAVSATRRLGRIAGALIECPDISLAEALRLTLICDVDQEEDQP